MLRSSFRQQGSEEGDAFFCRHYRNVSRCPLCILSRPNERHIDVGSEFLEDLVVGTRFYPNVLTMELLLNLLWLLLAMPAFWLWRYSRTAPEKRKASPFHTLLALGCLLVILFPVISATDDLHAMRAEMEEPPASKRSIGQSSGDKSSPSHSLLQPALTTAAQPSFVPDRAWFQPVAILMSTAVSPAAIRASRAPPLLPA